VWVAAAVPLGGVSAAVAARAMIAELAARHPTSVDQRLRSIHCSSPPRCLLAQWRPT